MENQELYEVPNEEQKPVEKIKITFSRKLARPFTTKAGNPFIFLAFRTNSHIGIIFFPTLFLRYGHYYCYLGRHVGCSSKETMEQPL